MTTRRHALGLAAGGLLAATQAWPQTGAAPPTPATTAPSSDLTAGLDAWLESQRVAWRVPGLAVALVKDGQVLYTRGFGLRDAAQALPVNTDTLFRGASTTKVVFGKVSRSN